MNSRSITSFHQSTPSSSTSKRISNTTPGLSLSRTSSRNSQSGPSITNTSKRGDIPRRVSSSSLRHHPDTVTSAARMSTSSPSPRKPRRVKGGGAGRSTQRQPLEETSTTAVIPLESSDDDQALFDLLGVTSPPVEESKKGLLTLSKESMDAALGRSKQEKNGSPTPKTRSRQKSSQPNGVEGEPRPKSSTRSRSKLALGADQTVLSAPETGVPPPKAVSGATSGPSKKRQPKAVVQHETVDQTFDVTSLSQSLPSNGFFVPTKDAGDNVKGKNRVKDESSVWEMPIEPAPTGSQELTWQQKLQNQTNPTQESTPKRKSSDRKSKTRAQPTLSTSTSTPPLPSPFNPKLTTSTSIPQATLHTRRLSLDPQTAPSMTTRSHSQFDGSLPYHTGMNVNRAPQTPIRPNANGGGGAAGAGFGSGFGGGGGELPILAGEFPRIGKKGGTNMPPNGAAVGSLGVRYAGPTFHNSPHAGSLPKPDLDDF